MIELTQSEVVREYELTYLLPTTLTSSETTQVQEKIAQGIGKLGGSVVTSEDWGKRELAYAIRHSGSDRTEALYTHMVISLPAQNAQALERELQLNTQVMRHLLILAEPKTAPAEKQQTQESAA